MVNTQKIEYDLWIRYHKGLINRELTEEEYEEIRAFEFAIHFLVPTKLLIQECGGVHIIENGDILHDYNVIRYLADKFLVSTEVIEIKLDYVIKEIEKAKERRKNARLIRRLQLRKKEISQFGEYIKK